MSRHGKETYVYLAKARGLKKRYIERGGGEREGGGERRREREGGERGGEERKEETKILYMVVDRLITVYP